MNDAKSKSTKTTNRVKAANRAKAVAMRIAMSEEGREELNRQTKQIEEKFHHHLECAASLIYDRRTAKESIDIFLETGSSSWGLMKAAEPWVKDCHDPIRPTDNDRGCKTYAEGYAALIHACKYHAMWAD